MDAKEAIALGTERGATMVDMRFVDMPGTWQHFTVPLSELTEDVFREGVGFDGSSIRGFQAIHESDMLLIPDPNSALMDPFTEQPTGAIAPTRATPATSPRKPSSTCWTAASVTPPTSGRKRSSSCSTT